MHSFQVLGFPRSLPQPAHIPSVRPGTAGLIRPSSATTNPVRSARMKRILAGSKRAVLRHVSPIKTYSTTSRVKGKAPPKSTPPATDQVQQQNGVATMTEPDLYIVDGYPESFDTQYSSVHVEDSQHAFDIESSSQRVPIISQHQLLHVRSLLSLA